MTGVRAAGVAAEVLRLEVAARGGSAAGLLIDVAVLGHRAR